MAETTLGSWLGGWVARRVLLPPPPSAPGRRPRGEVCPGYESGGTAEPCCGRAGEYNGFGSDGPLLFRCPKSCGCHD